MAAVKNKPEKIAQSLDDDWRVDAEYDVRYNRWLLKSIGIWPVNPSTSSVLEKLSEKFFTSASIFLLGMFLIPHGSYILLVESDRDLRLKMIGPLSFCMMACGKYSFALANKNGIASCVDRMADDWKGTREAAYERELMIKAGQWCEKFTKLCVTFMFGGAMSYSVVIPIVEQITDALRGNATRVLTFPSYFGPRTVDVYAGNAVVFETLFVVHSMSMVVMCTISSGLCTLMAKFVMHACGQLKIIIKNMKLLVEDDRDFDARGPKANLKIIVIKHLRVLKFIKDVEKTLTGICFVEFIGCTFNICLCGYYFITELEKNEVPNAMSYISLLSSFVSNIFVFCYLGERLTEQCQKIGSETYSIDWARLLIKQYGILDIGMIIMISQHPPRLTAGKIFYLTMDSFTSVIKAAATYLNMLRKVT